MGNAPLLFKPLLHRAATLERPENWPEPSVIAKTQKVLFLWNLLQHDPRLVRSLNYQTNLMAQQVVKVAAEWRQNHCHGGLRVAMVADWRHSGRHSDCSMDATGRLKEAQWWYRGDRNIAQIHGQCIQQHAFLTGPPMANPCAFILRPRGCVCLPPSSFERPVSAQPPRRPLCDCFEHAQNFTATVAFMARSERPLCHPWTTKATLRPPFCLQRRPSQFCGSSTEAQKVAAPV